MNCRTQLVNDVRGAVKSFGHRLPKCPARSFHKRAQEHIPEALLPALGPILVQIGSLTECIRKTTENWRRPPGVLPGDGALRQVEGIGPLTALAFVLTLEDPHRFEKSRSVGAYLGLCQPGTSPGTGIPRSASPRKATRC